jgi:hypothetical protein
MGVLGMVAQWDHPLIFWRAATFAAALLSAAFPVVRLDICIAGIRKAAKLSVSNRGRFIYRLLLGRRFLANTFTIDPSRKFPTPPNCG